ncbi:uncharacterized protein LOC143037690 [Oratosquilla oratoria]|uniref:uncharacterized protein LOC143037690 n=1 Tax=Oratosquilla oratoria TaxID=337810 RepID=UPI003F75A653
MHYCMNALHRIRTISPGEQFPPVDNCPLGQLPPRKKIGTLPFVFIVAGLHHNTKVDRLAKEACRLSRRGDGRPLSLLCYLNRVRSAALLPEQRRRDTERPFSVTITHYESVCRHKYKYRRKGLMVRRHNVVSARLRLGYRPPWQVAGVEGEPVFTECRLCHAPLANTIEHYCLACPTVKHLIPQGLPLDAICRHLLSQNRLDEILVRYPRFGGFS